MNVINKTNKMENYKHIEFEWNHVIQIICTIVLCRNIQCEIPAKFNEKLFVGGKSVKHSINSSFKWFPMILTIQRYFYPWQRFASRQCTNELSSDFNWMNYEWLKFYVNIAYLCCERGVSRVWVRLLSKSMPNISLLVIIIIFSEHIMLLKGQWMNQENIQIN